MECWREMIIAQMAIAELAASAANAWFGAALYRAVEKRHQLVKLGSSKCGVALLSNSLRKIYCEGARYQ